MTDWVALPHAASALIASIVESAAKSGTTWTIKLSAAPENTNQKHIEGFFEIGPEFQPSTDQPTAPVGAIPVIPTLPPAHNFNTSSLQEAISMRLRCKGITRKVIGSTDIVPLLGALLVEVHIRGGPSSVKDWAAIASSLGMTGQNRGNLLKKFYYDNLTEDQINTPLAPFSDIPGSHHPFITTHQHQQRKGTLAAFVTPVPTPLGATTACFGSEDHHHHHKNKTNTHRHQQQRGVRGTKQLSKQQQNTKDKQHLVEDNTATTTTTNDDEVNSNEATNQNESSPLPHATTTTTTAIAATTLALATTPLAQIEGDANATTNQPLINNKTTIYTTNNNYYGSPMTPTTITTTLPSPIDNAINAVPSLPPHSPNESGDEDDYHFPASDGEHDEYAGKRNTHVYSSRQGHQNVTMMMEKGMDGVFPCREKALALVQSMCDDLETPHGHNGAIATTNDIAITKKRERAVPSAPYVANKKKSASSMLLPGAPMCLPFLEPWLPI